MIAWSDTSITHDTSSTVIWWRAATCYSSGPYTDSDTQTYSRYTSYGTYVTHTVRESVDRLDTHKHEQVLVPNSKRSVLRVKRVVTARFSEQRAVPKQVAVMLRQKKRLSSHSGWKQTKVKTTPR